MTTFEVSGHTVGRYRIDALLGEGGMSVVYRARDQLLGKDVAVKFIRTERIIPEAYPEMLRRFRQEATSLARLSHPNILKITDFGEYAGRPYFVTELVRGGTLPTVGRPLPWPQAVSELLPIARALAYAHTRGIIHRDVKPSNILLAEDGTPVLADFGIAKLLDDEYDLEGETATAGIGTPDYMAPEQVLGRAVDARADVYALGAILYERVTGQRLFAADTPVNVMLKHVHEPPPQPRRRARSLPVAGERVLLRALAKDPAARFASMTGFVAALEATTRRHGWSWRGALRSALVLLGVAGGIALGILAWQRQTELLAAAFPTPHLVQVTVMATPRPVPTLAPTELLIDLLPPEPTPADVYLVEVVVAGDFPNADAIALSLVSVLDGQVILPSPNPRQNANGLTFTFTPVRIGAYRVVLVDGSAVLSQDQILVAPITDAEGGNHFELSALRSDLRVFDVRHTEAGQAQITWRPLDELAAPDRLFQVDLFADGRLLARSLAAADERECVYPAGFLVLDPPVQGTRVLVRVRVVDGLLQPDVHNLFPSRILAEGWTQTTWATP